MARFTPWMSWLALTAGGLTGCSAGFDRKGMEENLWHGQRIFTDDEVRRVEQLRPQIQLPVRIAVVPPYHDSWRERGDVEGERDEILAWGERLKREGIASEFIVIPRMLLQGNPGSAQESYWHGVRAAAARCHADVVLLLSTATQVDAYANPLSLLNLTIVGVVVAPGHHRDALTLVEGIVIDTRNEYLYFSAVSEGMGSTLAPYALVEEKDAIRRSRLRALKAFGDEFVKGAQRLKAPPPK